MSPEQAAGRTDQLGPATDIYSLGATLFELLTGKTPIGAESGNEPQKSLSILETLQRVREGRFPRPSAVNPNVPRALEAVCLKAMQLRPKDRYASARDLAADLEAWLADEPVTAWTEPFVVRTRRWMRRHQTAVVSTVATALVAIVALSVLALVVTDRNKQVKTEADNARAVLKFFKETVLSAARPIEAGGFGADVTIRAAIDSAEPKIAITFRDQPFMEAAIRDTIGTTYAFLDEGDLAVGQHERSHQLYLDHYGPDETETLFSKLGLALAYKAAGKIDQAVPLLEQTLAT